MADFHSSRENGHWEFFNLDMKTLLNILNQKSKREKKGWKLPSYEVVPGEGQCLSNNQQQVNLEASANQCMRKCQNDIDRLTTNSILLFRN